MIPTNRIIEDLRDVEAVLADEEYDTAAGLVFEARYRLRTLYALLRDYCPGIDPDDLIRPRR